MPYQLEPFSAAGLTDSLLGVLIAQHESATCPALRTLWTYYRNPIVSLSSAAGTSQGLSAGAAAWNASTSNTSQRLYRLGQERGLPSRLSGRGGPDRSTDDRAIAKREIVIENDIAWRIHTMVDFMFGRRITLLSTAADETLRRTIERVLDAVWESSGGIGLLQDIGLLGHVYGYVDLLVRSRDRGSEASCERAGDSLEHDAASAIGIEIIEPTRGIPLPSADDFRTLSAYVIQYQRECTTVDSSPAANGVLSRVLGWRGGPNAAGRRAVVTVTELFSGESHQLYEENADQRGSKAGPRLIDTEANTICPGEVPVVHIQNVSQPFMYPGISEVEPLIPLQDELNTRLCDRASRVTMQSFKMFLAKGIDGFDKSPVGPGQVWATDNIDARVESFGGDAGAPGEDEHIEQIREAMDKASGVPPLASGVVRAKIGNLTSENALRVTLMGLLSKTARKRVSYGRGITEVCRLILTALNELGILKTNPSDRGVRVEWPDPLPRDEKDLLAAAKAKIELGVPRERVLSELGYSPADPGIV